MLVSKVGGFASLPALIDSIMKIGDTAVMNLCFGVMALAVEASPGIEPKMTDGVCSAILRRAWGDSKELDRSGAQDAHVNLSPEALNLPITTFPRSAVRRWSMNLNKSRLTDPRLPTMCAQMLGAGNDENCCWAIEAFGTYLDMFLEWKRIRELGHASSPALKDFRTHRSYYETKTTVKHLVKMCFQPIIDKCTSDPDAALFGSKFTLGKVAEVVIAAHPCAWTIKEAMNKLGPKTFSSSSALKASLRRASRP